MGVLRRLVLLVSLCVACGSSSDETGAAAGSGGMAAGGASGDGGTNAAAACFENVYVNQAAYDLGPDYSSFAPSIGSHCRGTNHQDIRGVERVVFLGDSVTVGTPPTSAGDFYRSRLERHLAQTLGLAAAGDLWEQVNPFDGTALQKEAGAFASCAKWGARTDDLAAQIADCYPTDQRQKVHLTIFTMGGNDLANLAEQTTAQPPFTDQWNQVNQWVQLQREAVQYLVDPANFPNGHFVVFANTYEFTDGVGDPSVCGTSTFVNLDAPWEHPAALAEMLVWANEQYMQIAVESGTDMIFLFEDFCGHGYNSAVPEAPCYRGPGNENWFDLTCIHPTPTGHEQIANAFAAVVEE